MQCLHMQKPGILEILEHSEPFHNCILTHLELCHIYKNLQIFRTMTYLKPDTYSELSQRLKMEFFLQNSKMLELFFQSALSYIFERVLNMSISQ